MDNILLSITKKATFDQLSGESGSFQTTDFSTGCQRECSQLWTITVPSGNKVSLN